MRTDRWHGDVIAGMASYDELDHELVDTELAGYRPARAYDRPGNGDADCPWSADEGEEWAAGYLERLREVADRPDAEIRRDVLRALVVDSLVPISVDAEVRDGIVTLSGAVSAECERADAKYLAGLVPGVFGVVDELTGPAVATAGPSGAADGVTAKGSVAVALSNTAITDITELTIDEPRPGTVVLSGPVQCRSDHDLAIATAWSVADVQAVDDCIHIES